MVEKIGIAIALLLLVGVFALIVSDYSHQVAVRTEECHSRGGQIIDDRGQPCYNIETGKRIFLSTDVVK